MSGPFHIETAEPGDVLLVEIQDVQPLQDHPWGFTGVFHRHNGGGFLDEMYPESYVQLPCLQFESDLTSIVELGQRLSGTLKEFSAPPVTFPMYAFRASYTQASWAVLPPQRSWLNGTDVRAS